VARAWDIRLALGASRAVHPAYPGAMSDPLYGWQVRLSAATSEEAASVLRQLRVEGLECSRSSNDLFVSASSKAKAEELANRLGRLEGIESARPQLVGAMT
jgi:hypothetical protein